MVFTTPPLERVPQRIALNTRSIGGGGGGGTHGGPILAAVLGVYSYLFAHVLLSVCK